jgi:hypothetical protein
MKDARLTPIVGVIFLSTPSQLTDQLMAIEAPMTPMIAYVSIKTGISLLNILAMERVNGMASAIPREAMRTLFRFSWRDLPLNFSHLEKVLIPMDAVIMYTAPRSVIIPMVFHEMSRVSRVPPMFLGDGANFREFFSDSVIGGAGGIIHDIGSLVHGIYGIVNSRVDILRTIVHLS